MRLHNGVGSKNRVFNPLDLAVVLLLLAFALSKSSFELQLLLLLALPTRQPVVARRRLLRRLARLPHRAEIRLFCSSLSYPLISRTVDLANAGMAERCKSLRSDRIGSDWIRLDQIGAASSRRNGSLDFDFDFDFGAAITFFSP